MKITKYDQSCLLIETKGKRILVDPGSIGYTEERLNDDWIDIDVILVTHKHFDHCQVDAINQIIARDKAVVYTSNEVVMACHLTNSKIVKQGDVIDIDNIKIEVTKAIHGFLMTMKNSGSEVLENVGYIIDDGEKRLYTTSDTISFNHNYKCDILCMPFNGNGLTTGIIDGLLFVKDINPQLLLPIHMQHPNSIMNPNLDDLEKKLTAEGITYNILSIGETIEV